MTIGSKALLMACAISVTVAGFGGAADAQQPPRTPRAIRVDVGGYMEQSFGYAHNLPGVRVSQARQTGSVPVVIAEPNRFAQQSDSEIWFSGRAALASGTIVGFVVQLEGNTQFSDQIDESYLFVQGAFGRLLLGSENDAAYLQHVSAPRPGAGWGVLESAVTSWIYVPRFVSLLTTTAPLSTGDDQKLTYFTPRWSGVQLGASLTPNDKQDSREFSDRARERTNVTSVSGNGRWQWGALNLGASAGWIHGAGVSDGTAPVDRRHPLDDWAVGAESRYRGTAIGAGFRRLVNKGGALDGRAVAAGVTQEFGSAAVGIGYLGSRVAGTPNSPGRDRGDVLLLSASYPLGAGVAWIGSGFLARYDNGRSRFGAEDRNRGAGLVTGLRLSF